MIPPATLNVITIRLQRVEARNNILSMCANYIVREMNTMRAHNEPWLNEMSQKIEEFEKECATSIANSMKK
jgi:hypothetical protein